MNIIVVSGIRTHDSSSRAAADYALGLARTSVFLPQRLLE